MCSIGGLYSAQVHGRRESRTCTELPSIVTTSLYVDHAATTPLRPEVIEAMLPLLRESWGNPSSLHSKGREARAAMDRARRIAARTLGAEPDEVIFTASGTEGANLAIQGAASAAAPGRTHLVTTSVEHPAVLECCRLLERRFGFSVTYLPVDALGRVRLDDITAAVNEQTALVSVMYANNEVGTIQLIREIAALAHQAGALMHTDAVQAVGALPLNVQELGVDLLSITAHKFYGPKGIGALYVRRGGRLMPLIRGGGQERGRRPGTENVAAMVGLATALELAEQEREAEHARLSALSQRLLTSIPARVPGTLVTGDPRLRLPNHASVAFANLEIDEVLVGLDREEIWASSGSACTSASAEPSHVLTAMGVPRSHLFGALRLTLGRETREPDVDRLLEAIPRHVMRARSGAVTAEMAARL